ncbi:MAG TPA: hypothetical protein VMZ28_04065 [Kofleriaceae bacterium]|nr:hypothetical protein [Kofleriaceae bacterium]
MTRCRTLLLVLAVGTAALAPRPAAADRRADAARLAAPLRSLLARFLPLEPERPAPLDDEFDAEAIDRARASRRAERAERELSDGAAAGARRASAPSSP